MLKMNLNGYVVVPKSFQRFVLKKYIWKKSGQKMGQILFTDQNQIIRLCS